ncbi:eppin-like [Sceloporus undulatus]|uniref:eppin-like n=1 Tax=Sceloporus undulatus TaxID=8520 RepID=UPI001C4BDD7B|nr:eppin-like [Sceloporus undulatus]
MPGTMVASISLALFIGILALSTELPGAKAKERSGYCINVPVPSKGPSDPGPCTKCHADADCPPKKKCCGSPCGNTCQTPEPVLCRLPPMTGPCKARMPKFYYNWKSKKCEEFIYGGCFGNLNRFDTKEKCQRTCGKPG